MMERLVQEYRAALQFRDQRGRRVPGPHAPGCWWSGDGRAQVTSSQAQLQGLAPRSYGLASVTKSQPAQLHQPQRHLRPVRSDQADLALSDAQLGWLASAYVLMFSLAALPFGILSDLSSRRAVITLGMVLWSAFTMASGFRHRIQPAAALPRPGGDGGRGFQRCVAIAHGRLLPAARTGGGPGDPGGGHHSRRRGRHLAGRPARSGLRMAHTQ